MNKLDRPLVSVIIPFFNRIGMTMEAVDSVFTQTIQDLEVILVNDGSTEDTSLISKITDSRLKIINQENSGPAAARNNGCKKASGKYIAFLDSDDLFLPHKLETQIEICEQNMDVNLFHTSYYFFDQNSCENKLMNSGIFGGNVFPKILYYCPIATPTVIIRREVLDAGINYEEKYKISEDIIFYSKIAKQTRILGIDIPLTIVRGSSKSHAYSHKAQISGYQNILDYLEKNKVFDTKSQELEVKQHINENLKFHKNSTSIFLILKLKWISFMKAENKLEKILQKIKSLF